MPSFVVIIQQIKEKLRGCSLYINKIPQPDRVKVITQHLLTWSSKFGSFRKWQSCRLGRKETVAKYIAPYIQTASRPISVTQCFNCQSFGHSAKNCRSKQKCLICGESHSHKGCPNKEAKKAKCANCLGPHVASYRGCPEYKNRRSGNMW